MNFSEFYQNFFWLVWYLIAINIFAFLVYGADKLKSGVNKARRISERTLIIIALAGGSLGALAGMKIFRHKTRKLSFQAKLAAVLGLQILVIWWLFRRG
jgi:uncharacterized membrane protein YsdA (DUF1294 family)